MSHAVVAVPISQLTKGKVPAVAVIVGSVSPDFPYLLVLTPTHAPGHTLMGALIYCIVPSLAVLFVWFRWLESPTLAFWKLPLRNQAVGVRSIPLIILGVFIGAMSHVLWDSTSHSNGDIVQGNTFWHIEFMSLPMYKWNQYISGVFGLGLLGLWYLCTFFKNLKTPYTGNLKMGVIIYFISLVGFTIAANLIHQSSSLADIAVRTSIGLLSGGVIAMVVYGVMNQARYNA